MSLNPTDLKKGAVFQLDGIPYRVLEYQQHAMGRGSSNVSVKLRDLTTGKTLDKTFKGSENIDKADISSRTVQFLYADGSTFHFMDPKNYEQYALPKDSVLDLSKFIKDGDEFSGQFFSGQLINIELPKNLPLKVTYTEAAVKGDTSTSITKDATLETGLVVKVPAFIKVGDEVSVDTETGTYRARIKG